MKWWIFLVGDFPSCLHCKHYVPFPPSRMDHLGKCKVYHSFTDWARKDEQKCGLKANNFTQN
jgi:hypothetical protein